MLSGVGSVLGAFIRTAEDVKKNDVNSSKMNLFNEFCLK